MASQGFVVPAGISAQSLPSVTVAGALPVLPHGSLPALKSPLTTCCAANGASDTLSTQNVQASLLPPIWNATCPLVQLALAVNRYENCCGVVVNCGAWSVCVPNGASDCPTSARTVTLRLADAVKLNA